MQTKEISIGHTLGWWTVAERSESPKLWLCRCRCGTERALSASYIIQGSRRSSCGCRRLRPVKSQDFTIEFAAFSRARDRCTNSNSGGYKYYGGRGVEFRFASFAQFYNELGERPGPGYSINRIDNNGHYEPGNVEWATAKQQAENRNPRGSFIQVHVQA